MVAHKQPRSKNDSILPDRYQTDNHLSVFSINNQHEDSRLGTSVYIHHWWFPFTARWLTYQSSILRRQSYWWPGQSLAVTQQTSKRRLVYGVLEPKLVSRQMPKRWVCDREYWRNEWVCRFVLGNMKHADYSDQIPTTPPLKLPPKRLRYTPKDEKKERTCARAWSPEARCDQTFARSGVSMRGTPDLPMENLAWLDRQYSTWHPRASKHEAD